MQFSVDAVREVARLLQETGLQEITVENTDSSGTPVRIRAKRDASPIPAPKVRPAARTTTSSAPAAATEPILPSGPQPIVVTAAAVGVFRQPPLQPGDTVKRKDVVAVVESLKIPSEITAPQNGTIAEYLVEDGHGVEYGQPLLVITPEGV